MTAGRFCVAQPAGEGPTSRTSVAMEGEVGRDGGRQEQRGLHVARV